MSLKWVCSVKRRQSLLQLLVHDHAILQYCSCLLKQLKLFSDSVMTSLKLQDELYDHTLYVLLLGEVKVWYLTTDSK